MESKIQMLTSVVEIAEEKIKIDDDEEGVGEVRAESRADEPGDEHSHDDHEKYDQVQYDQEQKLYVYTI